MSFDVKNESEVKEYLDKLGIEYRFGCFSEKKPEGKRVAFAKIIIQNENMYFGRNILII